MSELLTGIFNWVKQLILDVASGKKSLDEARKECEEKGILVTETESDQELKAYEDVMGMKDSD